MQRIKLSSIEMDPTINCRASIDEATVGEYAAQMSAGIEFPPVLLCGTPEKSWLGDGWHRVAAARKIGATEISADLHPGGRVEALKHALAANTTHGRRRTNDDKRRCVEIALREFPKSSSRVIADMCGVGHTFVDSLRRGQVASDATSKRKGQDGKEYPGSRQSRRASEDEEPSNDAPKAQKSEGKGVEIPPPREAMRIAHMAVLKLEEIEGDDLERERAFNYVATWVREHRAGGAGANSVDLLAQCEL